MVSEPACLDLPKLSRHGDKLNLLVQLRWKCLHSYANLSGNMNYSWLAAVKCSFFSSSSFFQYIDLQIYSMNIWKNPFEKSSFFSDDQLWLISIEQALQADWQAENCTPRKSSRSWNVKNLCLCWYDMSAGRPRIVGIYLTCLLTVAAETRKVRGSSKLSRSSHEAAGATRAAILPE